MPTKRKHILNTNKRKKKTCGSVITIKISFTSHGIWEYSDTRWFAAKTKHQPYAGLIAVNGLPSLGERLVLSWVCRLHEDSIMSRAKRKVHIYRQTALYDNLEIRDAFHLLRCTLRYCTLTNNSVSENFQTNENVASAVLSKCIKQTPHMTSIVILTF